MGATFTPKQGHFKWYSGGVYGAGAWGSQDERVINVGDGDSLILAGCVHDTGGKAANNLTVNLQYSTTSDFSSDVNNVGEQGATDKVFRHRNDASLTDKNAIPSAQLSCTTENGTIHGTVDVTPYEDFAVSSHHEVWFVIEAYNVVSEEEYWFRLVVDGAPILLNAEVSEYADLQAEYEEPPVAPTTVKKMIFIGDDVIQYVRNS